MGRTNCEITFFTILKPKEENLQGFKLRTKRSTLMPKGKSYDLAIDYWKIAAIILPTSRAKKN